MSSHTAIVQAFQIAKREALADLKNPEEYELSQYTSINHVYAATEQIQAEQARTGNMRHLSRIKPYLEGLSQYMGVMDVFSQVKADIASLIWGPIKLLLQMSSALIKCYDKMIDVMAQIGDRLPQFEEYGTLFRTNERVQRLLPIFFRDILDFHVTALKFFKLKKWSLFFESLWPKHGSRINIVAQNLERHSGLIASEVTLAEIVAAQEAREQALQSYARDQQFQSRQDFEAARQALTPRMYFDEQASLCTRKLAGSGSWLLDDEEPRFKSWINPPAGGKKEHRLFWLQGIPGSGKTFLSSAVVEKTRILLGANVLFAFLTYKDPHTPMTKILHTFIFQLLLENPDLQPILTAEIHENFRMLSSNTKYVQDLLLKLLRMVESPTIVLDGLDELEGYERLVLLKSLLEVFGECENMRLWVSSRSEDDISKILSKHSKPFQINDQNHQDIEAFQAERAETWLDGSDFDSETCNEVKHLLAPIASKANGMMLYVKLVYDGLLFLDNLADVRDELNSLPAGLDQAYGRILKRLDQKLGERERHQAKRVLGWVGCSRIPIRQREIEAALSIRQGDRTIDKERKVFLNVSRLCGPVLEIQNGFVQFVHFTAKQYLFSSQTNQFLKTLDSHLDITKTCIRYLSLDILNKWNMTPASQVETRILSGDYVFLYYATTRWLDQVRICAELIGDEGVMSEELNNLCKEIETLFLRQENEAYTGKVTNSRRNRNTYQVFREYSPEIYEKLTGEKSFWDHRVPFLQLSEDLFASSTEEIPLNIFPVYAHIHSTFNRLLCPGSGKHHHRPLPDCNCDRLKGLYGDDGLHKCDRIFCKLHRKGFQTAHEREAHIRAHDRPYKCSSQTCEYKDIGFKLARDLLKHEKTFHRSLCLAERSETSVKVEGMNSLDKLLENAIEAGDIDFLSQYLPRVDKKISDQLFVHAIATSTAPVVEFFINAGHQLDQPLQSIFPSSDVGYFPLHCAVRNGNLETFNLLLRAGCDVYARGSGMNQASLNMAVNLDDISKKLQIIKVLKEYGCKLSERKAPLKMLPGTKVRQDEEWQLIELLELFKSTQREDDSFTNVFESFVLIREKYHLFEVTSYLLRNGVDVNTRFHFYGRHHPMQFAVVRYKSLNKINAEFLRFLLQSGADPYATNARQKTAGDYAAVKRLPKLLGMSWEELVESTAHCRKAAQP